VYGFFLSVYRLALLSMTSIVIVGRLINYREFVVIHDFVEGVGNPHWVFLSFIFIYSVLPLKIDNGVAYFTYCQSWSIIGNVVSKECLTKLVFNPKESFSVEFPWSSMPVDVNGLAG